MYKEKPIWTMVTTIVGTYLQKKGNFSTI